jgi:hypothetical protein
MAHFAKLDENNYVLAIHVVNNDVITVDGKESEQTGIDFLTQLYGHSNWKQTSYNSSFRKQYAGVGCFYDENLDAFISQKPFKSWSLDSNGDWQAPTPMPTDGKRYNWDEATTSWIEVISN